MMTTINRRVHIISRSGSWAVKKEGASRAIKVYPTKEDAIEGSFPYLQMGFDLVIHRKDGSVEQLKKAEAASNSFSTAAVASKKASPTTGRLKANAKKTA